MKMKMDNIKRMKRTSKFARLFKFLWLRNTFTINEEWDELLNKLINHGEVTDLNEYTITFDDKFSVWICNHPYGSGNLYHLISEDNNVKMMSNQFAPSMDTRIRLEDFVNNYIDNLEPNELQKVVNDYLNQMKDKFDKN